MLIPDKMDFKRNAIKNHTSSRGRYNHSKFYLIALKCIKQKLTELPGEILKSALIVDPFHLRTFSVIDIIKHTKNDMRDL